MTVAEKTAYELRREVRPGDAEAIVDLHRRVYSAEHGMEEPFVEGVAQTVAEASERGWPEGGGAWLIDGPEGLAGCLGLTAEGPGAGKIRWVVLQPELRGLGLGRRMITEAVEEARRLGMTRLELHTFAALEVAGAIYRSLGFRVVGDEVMDAWGPRITYQHYVLDL